MARVIGLPNLRFFGAQDYGGGAGAPTLALACMAIELGLVDVMVVWRSRNRSSGGRPWAGQMLAEGQDQFERPFGIVRPAVIQAVALHWFAPLTSKSNDAGSSISSLGCCRSDEDGRLNAGLRFNPDAPGTTVVATTGWEAGFCRAPTD